MISKIAAILLLCVSVFLYMTNTRVIENFTGNTSANSTDSTSNQTGGGLNESSIFSTVDGKATGGFFTNNYYQSPSSRAYSQGTSHRGIIGEPGVKEINSPGYEFYSTPRYGLHAGRGGDAIDSCNLLTNLECNSNPQCTMTDGGSVGGGNCKNTFDVYNNKGYSAEGYLEEQFQNGTMGAPYVRDSFKQQSEKNQELYNEYIDDNDDNDDNNIEQFGVKNNAAPKRGNLATKVQNARRGDIVGALRGQVKITENFNGYCPSHQISKSLGGGQSYSCSAITGVGENNDPLWEQQQVEKNRFGY